MSFFPPLAKDAAAASTAPLGLFLALLAAGCAERAEQGTRSVPASTLSGAAEEPETASTTEPLAPGFGPEALGGDTALYDLLSWEGPRQRVDESVSEEVQCVHVDYGDGSPDARTLRAAARARGFACADGVCAAEGRFVRLAPLSACREVADRRAAIGGVFERAARHGFPAAASLLDAIGDAEVLEVTRGWTDDHGAVRSFAFQLQSGQEGDEGGAPLMGRLRALLGAQSADDETSAEFARDGWQGLLTRRGARVELIASELIASESLPRSATGPREGAPRAPSASPSSASSPPPGDTGEVLSLDELLEAAGD